MLRNNRFSSRHRFDSNDDSYNPMNGVSNMADIMLVLACGLMMAVILFYKVDLKATVNVVDKKQVKKTENMQMTDNDGHVKGKYKSRGSVYEDPKTGKLYIVEPDNSGKNDSGKSAERNTDDNANGK